MDVLLPRDCQRIVPSLRDSDEKLWVYRFTHHDAGWVLSIATHAEPGSKKLSLGSFRIMPAERTEMPGFDPDKEAIALAVGVQRKVRWARVLQLGGPRARRDMSTVVGGKCVLQPTSDARMGQVRDVELLDWAIGCFKTMEAESGLHLVTGQDVGHGAMSDGKTRSRKYVAARFQGCVAAETALPTAEGNYNVLKGMLAAIGIQPQSAAIGFIGVGRVGGRVAERLHEDGASIIAVDVNDEPGADLEARGVDVLPMDRKLEMLREPLDALVVNTAGGSLDEATIGACVSNPRLKIVCGAEDGDASGPQGSARLLAAKKVYCPTEIGGIMGALTALEEYLTVRDGLRFEIRQMLEASKRLEMIGRQASSLIRSRGYQIDFAAAAEEIGGAGRGSPAAV